MRLYSQICDYIRKKIIHYIRKYSDYIRNSVNFALRFLVVDKDVHAHVSLTVAKDNGRRESFNNLVKLNLTSMFY